MIAVSADANNGWRHLTIEQRAGTGILEFVDFIQQILASIGQGTVAWRRCFIMNNLSSHRGAFIQQLIVNAGHRLLFRAPYYPVDRPIEYVFNTIEQGLGGFQYTVTTGDELQQAVQMIVVGINDFADYFAHCGY